MDETDLGRQLRSEADRITANAWAAAASGQTPIARDEVLTPQPREMAADRRATDSDLDPAPKEGPSRGKSRMPAAKTI